MDDLNSDWGRSCNADCDWLADRGIDDRLQHYKSKLMELLKRSKYQVEKQSQPICGNKGKKSHLVLENALNVKRRQIVNNTDEANFLLVGGEIKTLLDFSVSFYN